MEAHCRRFLPDVTSCSDFRHARFDCFVDRLSTPLLVLSIHVVFSISAYSHRWAQVRKSLIR